MKREILYKEFRSYRVWIVIFLIFFTGIVIGWFISSYNQINEINFCDNQEDIQSLCIGWANHKFLEKQSYTNSLGTNVLQQKYWIEIYENCMEDYNG